MEAHTVPGQEQSEEKKEDQAYIGIVSWDNDGVLNDVESSTDRQTVARVLAERQEIKGEKQEVRQARIIEAQALEEGRLIPSRLFMLRITMSVLDDFGYYSIIGSQRVGYKKDERTPDGSKTREAAIYAGMVDGLDLFGKKRKFLKKDDVEALNGACQELKLGQDKSVLIGQFKTSKALYFLRDIKDENIHHIDDTAQYRGTIEAKGYGFIEALPSIKGKPRVSDNLHLIEALMRTGKSKEEIAAKVQLKAEHERKAGDYPEDYTHEEAIQEINEAEDELLYLIKYYEIYRLRKELEILKSKVPVPGKDFKLYDSKDEREIKLDASILQSDFDLQSCNIQIGSNPEQKPITTEQIIQIKRLIAIKHLESKLEDILQQENPLQAVPGIVKECDDLSKLFSRQSEEKLSGFREKQLDEGVLNFNKAFSEIQTRVNSGKVEIELTTKTYKEVGQQVVTGYERRNKKLLAEQTRKAEVEVKSRGGELPSTSPPGFFSRAGTYIRKNPWKVAGYAFLGAILIVGCVFGIGFIVGLGLGLGYAGAASFGGGLLAAGVGGGLGSSATTTALGAAVYVGGGAVVAGGLDVLLEMPSIHEREEVSSRRSSGEDDAGIKELLAADRRRRPSSSSSPAPSPIMHPPGSRSITSSTVVTQVDSSVPSTASTTTTSSVSSIPSSLSRRRSSR